MSFIFEPHNKNKTNNTQKDLNIKVLFIIRNTTDCTCTLTHLFVQTANLEIFRHSRSGRNSRNFNNLSIWVQYQYIEQKTINILNS